MKLKQVLIGAVLAVAAMSLLAEATARPMGGGRSIGRQSQNVSRMPPAAAPQQAPRQAAPAPAPAPAPAMPPKPASPWKGILGGALLGLGIGALFSHFGFGSALSGILGSIIMLALLAGVVVLLFRLFGRKSAPAMAPVGVPAGYSGNNGYADNNNGYAVQPAPASTTPEIGARLAEAPAAAHTPWGVPADFDAASFLRVAKGNFIRLQAAWDKGDVADIREFTTPEVFAELKLQITERGAQKDYTDVVSIDAELLGIETSNGEYLSSVKFSGTIKPAPDALAEPFNEVWNLVKPVAGNGGWLLAGIQQLEQHA
ncbi:Tim44 domain-containing protein [Duganella qianjiadongensis]|uniref:TIM44-like domain-containing protein n=1 Tax=Duganella qianjiadongensis TaxID=2692176 RepID=A0ABW9VQU6_9BURK|nr:Tim44-like domain-containing protein [Duganella qianjiadongensis]MYM40945.1 TIM44-like domain-containing protein [Duganella qianjiadongensis]